MNHSEDHTALHAVYCAITKRDFRLTMREHFAWNVWKAYGLTEADLRLVVAHVNNLIAKGRRFPESLRFHNLIGNVDRFREDLAEARALARVPKVDKGKASVLAATGRSAEAPQPQSKSAEAIMRGNAELKKLLRLRDSL